MKYGINKKKAWGKVVSSCYKTRLENIITCFFVSNTFIYVHRLRYQEALMKELLSKERYYYKIHTSLMKSSAPNLKTPPIWLTPFPSFLQENLDPFLLLWFLDPFLLLSTPIHKEGVHTMAMFGLRASRLRKFCNICFSEKIGLFHKRGHPLSTYAKFSEKLTFLTPDTHTYVCVSGGKKC